MGIMYKLLVKHRNLRADITASRYEPQQSDAVVNADAVAGVDMVMDMDAAEEPAQKDPSFSAEHILQLCKFLAEKSKRHKELSSQQESARCFKYHNDNRNTREGFHARRLNSTDSCTSLAAAAAAAATATATATAMASATSINIAASHILTENLQAATKASLHSPASSCSMDYKRSKRDILLKIRSQILERKRQRKMACMLMQQRIGVWRPW